MSWHCSRALVEAFSGATCSGGAASALSSTTPTPDQFYWPDKTTEHSRLSRFGMTCEPLTAGLGAELLTWFLEASRARTLALPEKATDLTASDLDSGQKWPAWWVKYDPASYSWRTRQHSLAGDLDEFSGTWPRSGLMLDGLCYPLENLVPGTSANESGSWLPTIGKNEYRGTSKVRFRGSPQFRGAKMCEGLRTSENDPTYLHPLFGEYAMGWPLTWTELAPLETAKFPSWQQQHGACFHPIKTHERQS